MSDGTLAALGWTDELEAAFTTYSERGFEAAQGISAAAERRVVPAAIFARAALTSSSLIRLEATPDSIPPAHETRPREASPSLLRSARKPQRSPGPLCRRAADRYAGLSFSVFPDVLV